jgi:hypothetical protein
MEAEPRKPTIPERILCPDDAVQVVRACTQGLEVEGLLVLGLSCDRSLTGIAVNPRHRTLATVKVWELVDLTAELDACSLVLARFPKGRPRVPSDREANAFVDLAARAARARAVVLDCILMRNHQWWSLAERAAG